MKIFKNAIAVFLFGFTTIVVNAQEIDYLELITQSLIDEFEHDHYSAINKEIYKEGEVIEVINNGNAVEIFIIKKKPNGFTIEDDGPVVEIYSHYSQHNNYNLQLPSNNYKKAVKNSTYFYIQAYYVKANPQIKKVTVVIKNVKSNSKILALVKN